MQRSYISRNLLPFDMTSYRKDYLLAVLGLTSALGTSETIEELSLGGGTNGIEVTMTDTGAGATSISFLLVDTI